MSHEKVKTVGVVREAGYSYYLKTGDVWRKPSAGGAAELVAALGLVQDGAYIYFVDPDGDVSRKAKSAKAEPEALAPAELVTFAQAFAALRPHVGKAVTLALAAKAGGLRAGEHPITVFDWSALSADDRAMFAECQLYELARAAGKGWDAALVPCALVGGESHPVPLDELDQQCDGVLLLDLRQGGAVVYCADATDSKARPVAASAAALTVG